jgi:hypothetical protein
MAEPSTFPEEHVSEPIVYRRLSVLAILSCLIAAVFALAMSYQAILAFRYRMGFFLPMIVNAVPWIAVVMAIAALVFIRRSDGALAGAGLARTGLWIGLISSLGYWAYFGATYFATCQQADVQVRRWLGELRDGKIWYALWDSLDPKVRQSMNPEDVEGMKARIRALFASSQESSAPDEAMKRSSVVRPILQAGSDVTFETGPISFWDVQKDAYKVGRDYHITTPEGSYDARIVAIGAVSRNREWEGRQWKISAQECKVLKSDVSEVGLNVMGFRQHSFQYVMNWCNYLATGDLAEAFLVSLPEEQRAERKAKYAKRLVQAVAAATVPLNPTSFPYLTCACDGDTARKLFLDGYAENWAGKGKLVDRTEFQVKESEIREAASERLDALIRGDPEHSLVAQSAIEPISYRKQWKYENGVLEIPHDVTFVVGGEPGKGSGTGYAIASTVTLVSNADPTKPQKAPPVFRFKSIEFDNAEDFEIFRAEKAGHRVAKMSMKDKPPPGFDSKGR